MLTASLNICLSLVIYPTTSSTSSTTLLLLLPQLLQNPQIQSSSAAKYHSMAVQLGIYGAIPCCNSDGNSSIEGGMEYRLGPLAFHPNCPVVFLSVLRHRLEQLNSIPMPPLVYAVSLQVSRHLLGCIGSYNLASDLLERPVFSSSVDHSDGSSTSINYCPSTIKCTPHTGMLTVLFDCIHHTPHPRVKLRAVTDSSTSTATPEPSSLSASTVAVAATVSTASIAMVYGLSLSWTRRMGLSIYTSPLMSHLSVPPEVFLYGEGVLNRWATLQKQKLSSTATATAGGKKRPSSSSSSFCTHASSYAVLEAPRDGLSSTTSFPPSESLTFSDLYPVLLALRVGVDRSQGEQHCTTSTLSLHALQAHLVEEPTCTSFKACP